MGGQAALQKEPIYRASLQPSHAPSANLGRWIVRWENAMGRGLLVAAFDFSTAHIDEFHDWYDLEHIPERQTVPGFGACERWIGDEQPTLSVATYDLDSVDVLRSKAYASIAYGNLSVWSKRVTGMCKRLLRFEGTQIASGDAAAPEGAR